MRACVVFLAGALLALADEETVQLVWGPRIAREMIRNHDILFGEAEPHLGREAKALRERQRQVVLNEIAYREPDKYAHTYPASRVRFGFLWQCLHDAIIDRDLVQIGGVSDWPIGSLSSMLPTDRRLKNCLFHLVGAKTRDEAMQKETIKFGLLSKIGRKLFPVGDVTVTKDAFEVVLATRYLYPGTERFMAFAFVMCDGFHVLRTSRWLQVEPGEDSPEPVVPRPVAGVHDT